MPRRPGRPSKLTPAVKEKLISAIAAGNYFGPSCTYAGIDLSTFEKWMRRGRQEGSGQYFQFLCDVQEAEAQAEIRIVATWQQQIPQNFAAARDFLARRHPERWANKERLEQSGKIEHILRVVYANEDDRAPDQAQLPAPATNGVRALES